MGIQDRDYMRNRKQVNDIRNKKLKDVIENMTIGNLVFIVIGLSLILITWKTIETKIEENKLANIANNAIKRLNKAVEEDNKKMLEFVENSNKTIVNANKFEPIRRQGITPTPSIIYAPITQKQTTRSEICTTNIDTKERKCKFIN